MAQEIVAGIDLGSNGFHMIVARVDDGLFRFACCLNRGRSTEALPAFTLTPAEKSYALSLPAAWYGG